MYTVLQYEEIFIHSKYYLHVCHVIYATEYREVCIIGAVNKIISVYTRRMHTSRARLPKKLTFEPGDYVLKSSLRYVQRP